MMVLPPSHTPAPPVMSDLAEVLDAAMQLPESERRALALRLLDTVGDEPVEETERRWVEEA